MLFLVCWLLLLVAVPPLVAVAVPPELPVDVAELLWVLELELYDPVTSTLPPVAAPFPPAPVADAVLVLVLYDPVLLTVPPLLAALPLAPADTVLVVV